MAQVLAVWRRITALLAAAAFSVLIAAQAHAGPKDYPAAMSLAVERWRASQKPSGFLTYGFDFLKDTESEPGTMSPQQLVRQASTAAVVADYLQLTHDSDARELLARMLGALQGRSLPIGWTTAQSLVARSRLPSLPVGRFTLRAALERHGLLFEREGRAAVLVPGSDYAQAHTGATALALLAEIRYWHATGDNRFAELRRSWLAALIGLRIPGAGFRQVPTSIDHTPYYDGEAWLALAVYHQAFPDDAPVAQALADADDDLLRHYADASELRFFHWGTMAASARYLGTGDAKFVRFVEAQMRAFLKRKSEPDHDNTCASAEGVADGLGALVRAGVGTGELAAQARAWLTREMRKAEALQIQPGQRGLVFANAQVMAPRMGDFAGDFLLGTHRPSTQVDMTAHCISAMIKIRRQGLLQ